MIIFMLVLLTCNIVSFMIVMDLAKDKRRIDWMEQGLSVSILSSPRHSTYIPVLFDLRGGGKTPTVREIVDFAIRMENSGDKFAHLSFAGNLVAGGVLLGASTQEICDALSAAVAKAVHEKLERWANKNATAVRSAKDAVWEEAAKIVESYTYDDVNGTQSVNYAKQRIASAIRSKKAGA